MQRLVAISCLCLGLCVSLMAQSGSLDIDIKDIPVLELPALDNKTLLEEERALRAPGRAPRFAENIAVDVSPQTHGYWEEKNGRSTWYLRVPSPGAYSLNFGFDRFLMPEGGALRVHTADGREVQGPFTPADNETHEQLWTPVIPGDDVVIEVSLPSAQRELLELHLKSVNHDFLGFSTQGMSLLSGACNIDVACGEEDGWAIVDQYRDIIQSVAVIGLNGGTFCTGFLVNNARQDCTPFFMTADHCGIGNNNAASLVVYWNYANSFCRTPGSPESGANGDGVLTDFNTGSIFRASYAPSDMTLVELDDPVSETADAWFAGWDATDGLETDTVIAIHHPSTDEKRISFQYEGVYVGSWGSGDNPVPGGDHLVIEDWNEGTTEGGSSGSPIFDSEKRVIGQLHGGSASCFSATYDSYGWFFTSWTGGGTPNSRLSDWLDPDGTGILQLDGRGQLLCSFFAQAQPAVQNLCVPAVAEYDIATSDNFVGSVTLSLNNLPAGLTANFEQTTVDPGAGTSLTITGTENLAPGTYTFQLLGTDGSNNTIQDLTISVQSAAPAESNPLFPMDMAEGELLTVELSWEGNANTDFYEVEVATEPAFANVIEAANGLTSNDFILSNLGIMTTYYWRVRGRNICGLGNWSESFSFSTAAITCADHIADTEGVTIGPGAGTQTVSILTVTQNGLIADVSLRNLRTNHTYVGDLTATLQSPDGTIIDLFNMPDCPDQGLDVSFSDGASASAAAFVTSCDGGPVSISGEFQPAEPFATFAGEPATGDWVLTITDNFNGDQGLLEGWELEICTAIEDAAVIAASPMEADICPGETTNTNLVIGTGFDNDVTLSTGSLPAGASVSFETNPVAPGEASTATFAGFLPGEYTIMLMGDDGASTASVPFTLVVNAAPTVSPLQIPADNAEFLVGGDITFSWGLVNDAETYELEIATDELFDNIVYSESQNDNFETVSVLDAGQLYWRITTGNECGQTVSSTRSFVILPLNTVQLEGATLDLAPNPTYGPLRLSLSENLSGDINLEVMNTVGQRVQALQLEAVKGATEIDLSALPAGTYLLRFTHGAVQQTVRIAVQ